MRGGNGGGLPGTETRAMSGLMCCALGWCEPASLSAALSAHKVA